MRKSSEEATQTRKRIVEVASCEFRENGIVATGLDELMKAAGLTPGFLRALRIEGSTRRRSLCAGRGDDHRCNDRQSTMNAAVAAYQPSRHRDNPASRCHPSAIGSELARSDEKTRAPATVGFEKFVDVPPRKLEMQEARRRAIVAVSTRIGALTMSRIVADPDLSAEILSEVEESLTAA